MTRIHVALIALLAAPGCGQDTDAAKKQCTADSDCNLKAVPIVCTVGTNGEPVAERVPTGRCTQEGRCETRINNCLTTCEPVEGCLPSR